MNEFDEALRFKRQAPETRFFTMEAVMLNALYDLIEHMQQIKKSTSRDEINKLCAVMDSEIDTLRGHLRDVKAEIKLIKGSEPLSKQTNLSEPNDENP